MPGWQTVDGTTLERVFRFPNRRCATRFVDLVTDIGDAIEHHPKIELVGNEVTLRLAVASENGLRKKNHRLAELISQ